MKQSRHTHTHLLNPPNPAKFPDQSKAVPAQTQLKAGEIIYIPRKWPHHAVAFLDGYHSTVQGLLDWFEVDLGFTELLFIQIGLCVMCVFVPYSPVSLSSCPFLDVLHCQEPYKNMSHVLTGLFCGRWKIFENSGSILLVATT